MGGNYEEVNKEIKFSIVKFRSSTPIVAKMSKDLGGEIPMTKEKSVPVKFVVPRENAIEFIAADTLGIEFTKDTMMT